MLEIDTLLDTLWDDHWLIHPVTGKKVQRVVRVAPYVEWFPKWETLPDLGLYFLFRKGRLIYIGMSEKLPRRMEYHRRDRAKPFDGFCVLTCEGMELHEVLDAERLAIKHHEPPLNRNYLQCNV